MSKKIGIILVNWNGGQLTKDCIDSLNKGTVVSHLIVVVDNASHDDSIAKLQFYFGESIHIIKNEENKGFAEANNQGIEYLIAKGVDYIWLLNNDTVVEPNCLEELVEVYEKYDDGHLGAISAIIYYEAERNHVWYAGAHRNPNSFGIIHDEDDINDEIKTEFVSGCCIFTKAEIFKEYGVLQKEFIAYSEDSEWCLRLLKMGFYFICTPKAVLYHKVSASLKKNTGTYNKIPARGLYLMNRNHLWVIRKYAPNKRKSIIVMIAICMRNMLKDFPDYRRMGVYLKSLYHGLFDNIVFIG